MRQQATKFLLYFIGLLLVQEAIFRACFPLPELSNFDRGLYTVVDETKARGYIRNKTYFWESSVETSHKFHHRYNRYGFRDSEWKVAKELDSERIIFIGDSYVESVMSDSTMTQYFRAASAQGNLEVMNAGMLGTGITRYLRLITDIAPVFNPDNVVLVIYGNDFQYEKTDIPEYYLTPEFYSFWTPRVLELFEQWKRGTPVPFAWFQQPMRLFAKAGESGFAWNDMLAEMTENVEPDLAEAMNNGTFNHHRMNELMREEIYLKQERNLLVPMDYLRYYSEKFNFEPLVVYIPSRNQITDHYLKYEYELCKKCDKGISLTDSVYNQNQRNLAEVCSRFGISFLDLSAFMGDQERFGSHLYWNYDGHLNEKGTELVAEQIHRFYKSSE